MKWVKIVGKSILALIASLVALVTSTNLTVSASQSYIQSHPESIEWVANTVMPIGLILSWVLGFMVLGALAYYIRSGAVAARSTETPAPL